MSEERENMYIKIGTAIFFVLIIGTLMYSYRKKVDIQENGIIVNVKIVEYIFSAKGFQFADFRCKLQYNGKEKYLLSPSRISKHADWYVGQWYPAMYSQKYDAIHILITNDDFSSYGLKYPDSLILRHRMIAN